MRFDRRDPRRKPTRDFGQNGVLGPDADSDWPPHRPPAQEPPSLVGKRHEGACEVDRQSAIPLGDLGGQEVDRRGADELGDEAVRGLIEEVDKGPHLLQSTAVHYCDPVRNCGGLFLVVGDVNCGRAQPLVEPSDLCSELPPKIGLEVSERLV